MRAAGVQLDFDERGAAESCESSPVGACFARISDGRAVPGFAHYSHAGAVDGIAANGQIDASGFFREFTLYQRDVSFLDGALAEGFAKFGVRGIIFGDEDNPGGFLVETVNDAGAEGIAAA